MGTSWLGSSGELLVKVVGDDGRGGRGGGCDLFLAVSHLVGNY